MSTLQHDTPTKFSATTVILHWIVALSMIGLLSVGAYMAETKTYALYPLHKSFGVLIFVIIIARVIWRLKNGWPAHFSSHQPWEQTLAKIIHHLLLIGTLLMPISGFLMSSLGGHGVAVFGFELVAANPDPANPGKVIPINGAIAGIAHQTHGIVGWVLIVALFFHISGAVKHHLFDKDGTLKRMLGQEITL